MVVVELVWLYIHLLSLSPRCTDFYWSLLYIFSGLCLASYLTNKYYYR